MTLDKLETAAGADADDMLMNKPNDDGDGDDMAKTKTTTKTEPETETETNTLLQTGPLLDDAMNEGGGAGTVRETPKPLDRALCARRVQDIDALFRSV